MLLTVVNSRLESLKGGLVNPLQPLALILGDSSACHQEPACSELCLSITVGDGPPENKKSQDCSWDSCASGWALTNDPLINSQVL